MLQLAAMKPEALQKMGECSRKLIISKYDQNFVWNALLNEYKSILN
jgi:hypothetical protein